MATAALTSEIFLQLREGRRAEDTATYVAVPGIDTARWLLPVGNPEIETVLASWAPHRLGPRVAWTVVRAANRVGRLAEIPGASVLEAEGTRYADWAALGWRGTEAPIPVIYLGTPGRRRKAVVHLVDRASSKCEAIVKVPLTEEAKAAVLHEAEVLGALATEGYPHSPRLLKVDRIRAITTQTFVEGRPGSRRMRPEYWYLLRTLLLPGETTTLAEHAERWARDLAFAGDGSAESKKVAEAIDKLRDDLPLSACWEHGDFAPWNIKRSRDGGCALLDWEDAQRKGLPLLDAYHFLHMQDWLFDRRPELHAAVVADEGSAIGLSLPQVRALEAAYLIGAYVECLKHGNHERARFVSNTLTLRRKWA